MATSPMRKGRDPGAAHLTSATRASIRPPPTDDSADRQVSAARALALSRRGPWPPGGDLQPYRPQSRRLRQCSSMVSAPNVQSASAPPTAHRQTSSPWGAPSPASEAHRRLCQAAGPGSIRLGLAEPCAGLPAVEALTETEPVPRDAFGRAIPGTAGWSASQLLTAGRTRHSERGRARPSLCKVDDHPDVKVPLSMPAHALTQAVFRLIAAVLSAIRLQPSPTLADGSTPKEGS
jgi:hypothetical protein